MDQYNLKYVGNFTAESYGTYFEKLMHEWYMGNQLLTGLSESSLTARLVIRLDRTE